MAAAAEVDIGSSIGQVEPVAQLDQQSLGGLLADAGHQGERAEIAAGDDVDERRRRMRAEDGDGQRRTDAVGGDEHLEGGALVAAQEPEQRLRVFADVVVHVEEDR